MTYGRTSNLSVNYFIIYYGAKPSSSARPCYPFSAISIPMYGCGMVFGPAGALQLTALSLISLCSTVFRCGNPKLSFSFDAAPPGVTYLSDYGLYEPTSDISAWVVAEINIPSKYVCKYKPPF